MTIYIVRPGDTLIGIARRFSTTVDKLAYDNQLNDPSRLAVGVALVIGDSAPGGVRGSIETNGYAYPNISDSTLSETLPRLTFFCPFSWETDGDGTLRPIDDARLITASYNQNTAPLLTVTNLSLRGGFSSDIAHSILTNQEAQDRFVANVLAVLRQRRYYGLQLNFEYIYPFDRQSFNQFLARLSETLHNLGYYFITTVAPKTSDSQTGILYEGHDYAAHGQYADRVIVMTYEWGYTYSPPQAVSPVDKIRSVLDYAVTKIPAGKILMGYSNYGYNWVLPWSQGVPARVISNAGAVNLACSVFAQVHFDDRAQAPHFNYTDVSGERHEVWYEDPRSARGRLNLVYDYGLAGISYWTVNQLYRPGFIVLESMFSVEKII